MSTWASVVKQFRPAAVVPDSQRAIANAISMRNAAAHAALRAWVARCKAQKKMWRQMDTVGDALAAGDALDMARAFQARVQMARDYGHISRDLGSDLASMARAMLKPKNA